MAVADTRQLRARGLMAVEDLGDLDGMLFVMDGTVSSTFTMRDTLMALDVAFFDAAGALVDVFEMTPCYDEPCPAYRPAGPFTHAVEVPMGGFDDLDPADAFSVKG